jgi:hypothetical protein
MPSSPEFSIAEAVAALRLPLADEDRGQGWSDDLRRSIQETLSRTLTEVRKHGHWTLSYAHLPQRYSEWLDREAIGPVGCELLQRQPSASDLHAHRQHPSRESVWYQNAG